jgi:small subunit ribosomal protein S21
VKLTTVVLRPGESQEQLLKRFRKEVQKARILTTVKKKRYFVSNSEARRIAERKAERREHRRHLKAQRRNRW